MLYQCINAVTYIAIEPQYKNTDVGKLSACANSGYQALFSDFSNGPGYEWAWVRMGLGTRLGQVELEGVC